MKVKVVEVGDGVYQIKYKKGRFSTWKNVLDLKDLRYSNGTWYSRILLIDNIEKAIAFADNFDIKKYEDFINFKSRDVYIVEKL